MHNEVEENWKEIERIIANPNCWALAIRYDTDLCHLIRKDTDEVVWEGATDGVLTILEDTCNVKMSKRSMKRKVNRLLLELKEEVKNHE